MTTLKTENKISTSLFEDLKQKNTSIAIIGLGYVGLPLAAEFGKKYKTIGFDTNTTRINELESDHDRTDELTIDQLKETDIKFTNKPDALSDASIIIVTVPTPIDANNQPDLTPLKSATATVGRFLKKDSIVIYESTVFPCATEDICIPILEAESGLKFGTDFEVGYSPERLSPGDKERTLTKIIKIVSASSEESLKTVSDLYSSIIPAGIYKAASIKVAEAAKIIENTQRDLNVALMNELAIIFNKIGINTIDVIEAAATKWNFMKMVPGLVGGHCIDIDPYYLTYKAKQMGYYPQVILSGRRINSGMGKYIAEQTVKKIISVNKHVKGAKVLILGITFKENVPDIRNSKVVDIVKELKEYDVQVSVTDPFANLEETKHEYGIDLVPFESISDVDGIIIAVPHRTYADMRIEEFQEKISGSAHEKVLIDVKSMFKTTPGIREKFAYWTL